MRPQKIPALKFCPWVKWSDREAIENSEYPGVYLIGITKKNLETQAPIYKDVVYIGMTNAQNGLRGRWYQFHRSINGKDGHSGGNTVFRDLGHYDQWQEKLFVSAMPIICNTVTPNQNDLLNMGWVTYLEYVAFADFYQSKDTDNRPKYNTK